MILVDGPPRAESREVVDVEPLLLQVLGMPSYNYRGMSVTYWDVHYVEVESVNLYANGSVSITYPITKGYDPSGLVLDQSHFPGGRIHEQWL